MGRKESIQTNKQIKIFVLSILSCRFTQVLLYEGHPIKNETFAIGLWIHMLYLWNLIQSEYVFLAINMYHIRCVT